MAIKKSLIDSSQSGEVDPKTGLTGSPKSPKVKQGIKVENVERASKTSRPDPSLGSGSLDYDYTKYKNYGGLPTGIDVDEYRASNQSVGEQLAFGAGRFLGTTGTKFLTGIGYALHGIPAIMNGDINTMIDNGMSSMIQDGENWIKEDFLPIHHKKKYLDGNVLDQMSTFSFWMDDVVDGFAFMASAYLGASGLSAAGSGVKAYSTLAKQLSKGMRAAKLGKVGESSTRLGNIAKGMDFATINTFNSVTEGAFEAKETKDQVLKELENDIKLGEISEEEANLRASDAARGTFFWNVGALMPSNMVTNSMLFKKFDTLSQIGGISGLGKEVKPLSLAKKAGIFGKKSLLSMASEGAYEENIQLAVSDYYQDVAEGVGTDDSFIEQVGEVGKNMVNNFTTDEGQKNIALGSIIGILPGGIGGVREASATNKRKKALQESFNLFRNNVKDNFQKFYKTRMYESLDPEGNPIKDESGNPIVSEAIELQDGKPVIDEEKIKGNFANLYKNYANFAAAMKASNSGNREMFDFIRSKMFSNEVLGLYSLEGREETLDEWVDTKAEEEIESLKRSGKEISKNQTENLKEYYKRKGRKYFNFLEQIDNNFAGLANFPNTKEGRRFRNNLKMEQFDKAVDQDFWETRAEELQEEISEANREGNIRRENELQGKLDSINEYLQESYKETAELFDSSKQEKRFARELKEIEEASEGRGAVDDSISDSHKGVTEEDRVTNQTDEDTVTETRPSETEGRKESVKSKRAVSVPKHRAINSSNEFVKSDKFDQESAEANGYSIDETAVSSEYQTTETSSNRLTNNFAHTRSKNSRSVDVSIEKGRPEDDIQTTVNFTQVEKDGSVSEHKSYDTFESLQDELEIEEGSLSHGFKNFNTDQPFNVLSVEYGKNTATATIEKAGETVKVPIKNKDKQISLEQSENRSKPSVFYKANKDNKELHTILTDAEGNIVRDTFTKQQTFYSEIGSEYEAAFNYVNGDLSNVRMKSLETGQTIKMTIPSDKTYNVSNIDQAIKDFEATTEYSTTKPSFEEAESAITVQTANEIKAELKREGEEIAEETRQAIQAKIDKNRKALGLDRSETTEARRQSMTDMYNMMSQESFVKWMYTDTSYNNTSIEALFSDGSLKYVPAMYSGKVGVLERLDNNEVVFKEIKEDMTKGAEYILGTIYNTDTLSDLGIDILKDVPFNLEVVSDIRTLDIQGSYYTNQFESITDAIQYDNDGNPISVTLWDSDGNKIRIESPVVVHNTAYAIELQDAIEAEIFDSYFKDENDFTIFTYDSKNYAVYRKPDGKFAIYDVAEDRFVHKRRYAQVKEGFLQEMQAIIEDLSLKQINKINKSKSEVKNEIRKTAQSIRSATTREASKLPDESEAPSPERGKEETKKSKREKELEKEIEKTITEEAAHNEQAQEEREKQIEERAEQKREEEATKISDGVETLGRTETPVTPKKGPLEQPDYGIKRSASAPAYIWYDRISREQKVNNTELHVDIINTPAEHISFVPKIDFENTEFWPDNPQLKEKLQNEDLTEEEIDEILAVRAEDFSNPVDAIPVRLQSSVGGKTLERGIYLHTTAYDKISVPPEVAAIEDAKERQKAYEKHVRKEQMRNREVRKQILKRLLKDQYVEIPVSFKTKGTINNVGENLNIGDVLRKIDPNIDLRNVTLGVAVRPNAIYKDKEEVVDTVADVKKGNVVMETRYTANGDSALIKLNPSKLSREHAAIVFNAFKQAYSKGEGGFAGKYKGDEVTGDLTRLEVLNMLVYYGQDNTQIDVEDGANAHLANKQLWVEKAKILHFGTQKLNLHTASKQDFQRFIDWATTNKNYTVNRSMLGSQVKGKKTFSIGRAKYDSSVDNYNSFLIKNGLLKTDVDVVPGTESLFKHPIPVMDLEAGGIDSTAPKVTEDTIAKYSGQRQEPLKPQEDRTIEEQREDIERRRQEELKDSEIAKGKLLAKLSNDKTEKTTFTGEKLENELRLLDRIIEDQIEKGKSAEEITLGLTKRGYVFDVGSRASLKPAIQKIIDGEVKSLSDYWDKYHPSKINARYDAELEALEQQGETETQEAEETQVPEKEPSTNNPDVAEAAYGRTLAPLTEVAGIQSLPVGSTVYIPIKEEGKVTKYKIGDIVKGKKTGKVGIKMDPKLTHFMLKSLKDKLSNISSFSFDNANSLNRFKQAIRGSEEYIYFDSPQRPDDGEVETPPSKPTPPPKEPDNTYDNKPVEDQTDDTIGRKTDDTLPDTGDLSVDNIGPSPYRETSWAQHDYSKIDVKKELRRLNKRLRGNRLGAKIPVEHIDGLIKIATNRHAFAQFQADGFRLSNLAESGSILHEAFHRVSLAYLTDAQRQELYNDARKNYKKQLEEVYNKKEFTDKEVEEFLAEQYRDYALVKEARPEKEPDLNIPQRIAKFFRNLFEFLRTWFTGRTRLNSYDVASVFKAIDNGRFKYARISKDNLSKLKGKAYNLEIKGKQIESIQSPEEYREIVHNLFFLLAESNRLVEEEGHTGRVAVKISDFNDVKKIKFGPLYERVRDDRLRYNSAARRSDATIASIKNNTISATDLLEAKRRMGDTSLSKEELINRLQKNADIASRLYNIFNDIYNNFGTFKSAVEDYMASMNIQKITDESDIDVTEVDEETGETADSFEKYNKTSYMVSAKENTALSIKFLISMLPREQGRSSLTGLYKFVDFSPTWSKLINDLIGSRDIDHMIERLTSLSTDNITYQTLIKKLKEDENLKTQFYKTMQKYKHDFVNLLASAENAETIDYRLVNAAIQQASNRYVKEWGSNFITNKSLFKDVKGKGKIGDVSYYEEMIQEFNKLVSDSRRQLNNNGEIADLDSKINSLVDLLNIINIPVDNHTIRAALYEIGDITESHSFVNLVNKKIPYLFNEKSSIYNVLKGGQLKGAKGQKVPSNQLFLYENGALFLADVYAKSRPFDIGDTVYGPQGNRYYTIAQNTYMSDVIREFQNDPNTFVQKRLGSLYNQNSKFLQKISDPNNANKIRLLTMSAFLREDMYDTGREYQGITDLEDIMMRVTAIESDRLAPPTPADRRFYYFYEGFDTISKLVGSDKVYLTEEGNVPNEILDVFVDYYKDESARIKRVRKEVDKVLAGEMSSEELFENYHYSKYVGRDVKREGVIDGKELKSKGRYTGRGANFTHFNGFSLDMSNSEVRAKLQEVLKNRIESTISMFSDFGIITKDGNTIVNNLLSDKHLKKYKDVLGDNQAAIRSMIANYVLNTMYTGIEVGKVFTGDPAAFKSSEDYVKRLPSYTSTGDNLRLSFPETYYQGDELVHSDTYNITTFDSNVIYSLYYDDLVKLHSDYYLEEGIAKDETEATNIAEEKLAALKKSDQTDAQTFISPRMYRALSIKLGEWPNQKEEAYQLLQEQDTRELSREEKVKLSNVVMQPLKMTYLDIITKNGHSIPVLDKMSMATLFRPLVENTQLEELLDRMEAKGNYAGQKPIDQAKFHTAEKSGIKDRRPLFADEQETQLTDLNEVAVYSQNFGRLRHQLVTDPHEVSRTLVGSQFKKIGAANIYKDGIYEVEGEGELFGEDVQRNINELLSELSNRGINRFYNEMEVDPQDREFTNQGLLVSKLREEARKASLPDYLVESFKLDDNGNFYLEIDSFPGNRKWIQSRIISLIKKAAIDLKLPGNVFIQMSDIGLRRIDKSDELKFMDEEGYMEAKISVSAFRSLIPNFHNLTHEERVEYIKDKKLTSIGYRIPTQGQNSVYLMKIQEFLPESVGDVLVLPKEGPAIGGFDFDIDKMYVIRHNYKNGEKVRFLNDDNSTVRERAEVFSEEVLRDKLRNIRQEYADAIKETAAKIQSAQDSIDFAKEQIAELREYEEIHYDIEDTMSRLREELDTKKANYILKERAIEEVKALKKDLNDTVNKLKEEWVENNLEEFKNKSITEQNITQAVENRLLDNYIGVLQNKNNFIRRTTPLGYAANKMRLLAESIKSWKNVKEDVTGALESVSPEYQIDVKSRYKSGKQGLGPFALANVHHVLGQMSNIGLFKSLGIGHLSEDGTTDLSRIMGKDNIDITEWFSGLIDAHVDIAADPYIYYLNVNDYTRDAVTLMLRAGVGGMTTFKFTAQPILEEVAKREANRGNKLGISTYGAADIVRDKYLGEFTRLSKGQRSPTPFSEQDIGNIVSEGNLEYLLTHNNNRDADWYDRQLQVLDAFEYINSYAHYLTEATLTSRIDTKKFGSSYSEVVSFKNRTFKAYQDMNNGVGIKNYDKLMEDTYLNSLEENSREAIQDLLSDIVLEATPSFNNFLQDVLMLTGNYYTLDQTIVPNVTDEIYTNIYAEFFKEAGLNRNKASRLLYGEESIPKLVHDIRAGSRLPNLKYNRLIRILEPSYGENRPDFLSVFKPDNKWYRDDISRAWKEMFDGTPAERNFAMDLFYYSFLTSGFRGTVNSFHDLAPKELIKYSGLDGFIKRKSGDLSNVDNYFAGSMDNFFQNSWTYESLVPSVTHYDPSLTGTYKGSTFSLRTDQNKLFRGFNDKGEPVYAPYVKLGKKNPTLFKYAGYLQSNNEAVYLAIPKKGYRKEGFVVKENTYENTLFAESNKLNFPQHVLDKLNSDNFQELVNNSETLIRKYPDFIPMNESDMRLTRLKETSGNLVRSDDMAQARVFKRLDLNDEVVRDIEGGESIITLNDSNLQGFWTLPNNQIVWLQNMSEAKTLPTIPKSLSFKYQNNADLVSRGIKTGTSRNSEQSGLKKGESAIQRVNGVDIEVTYLGLLTKEQADEALGMPYEQAEAFESTTSGQPVESTTKQFIKGKGNKHIYKLNPITSQYQVTNYGYHRPSQEEVQRRIEEC